MGVVLQKLVTKARAEQQKQVSLFFEIKAGRQMTLTMHHLYKPDKARIARAYMQEYD